MSQIQNIANALKELDELLARCMKCGSCQAVCPIFGETLKESDVARGKLALIADLSASIILDARAVREKLDRCLLCGSCQSNCPSGVNILQIFMRAREIAAEFMGLSPIKKAVFRIMLVNPRLFSLCVRMSRPFSGLFLRPKRDPQNTVCAPLLSPFVGKRMIPQMPKKTLSELYPNLDIPAGKSNLKVLFFAGCMGDKMYVDVSEACLKIFKYHGIGVRIPQGLACCGIPALASGDAKSFANMARLDLDIISKEKFDYIVTACASCTETIRDLWKTRLDGKYRAMAEALSAKTLDISQFLVDVLKIDVSALPKAREPQIKVTYHDSCHLAKGLGLRKQPRDLIRMNPDCELVEMRESDRCCGCGGSFTLTHYDISKQIGERKRKNIEESGADIVACGCPACMMQITNMLALAGDKATVRHVAQIYADSLK